MVLDKLTLFELHFDDAQFGPARMTTGGDDADETAATPELEDETSEDAPATETESGDGGMGRALALAGFSVLLSVAVTLLARRLSGDDGETTLDEFADEPVEVETGDSGSAE